MIRAAVLMWALALPGTPYAQDCRQALALGLDVSGSVDAREYRLQMGGVATALDAPEVREKLLSMQEAPVALMIYEWSGPNDQVVVVPWTRVETDASIDKVIETLRQTQRRDATPGTALGVAMRVGRVFLDQQPDCWKHTLDISGDGKSNLGPRPRDVRDQIEASGITINGLVIGVDDPNIGDIRQAEIGELSSYFRAEVMIGPDAFVHTAIGFNDYARAMTQKLLKELESLVFSELVDQ
tara:strand:- start:2492 stop:3211 length:720 start_codon:yes stop_codon:yes gene_type:complete